MEVNMYHEHMMLMFNLFRLRIFAISERHGAGPQYIQGQLDEARHQIKLYLTRINFRNNVATYPLTNVPRFIRGIQ